MHSILQPAVCYTRCPSWIDEGENCMCLSWIIVCRWLVLRQPIFDVFDCVPVTKLMFRFFYYELKCTDFGDIFVRERELDVRTVADYPPENIL
jgi:hypothetical protein